MYTNPVISIDFGTQSVRVSIINNKGEFLAFEKVTYDKPYFSIKPGYCEQDPEYYYSCMCKASQALVEKNKDLVAKCEYFSITCFRDTAAYLDENYKVVRPSIIWLDQRQAKLEEKLPFLYRLIFGIIGMTDTVVFNRKRTPAHWLKENEKENWNKIRYYSPLSSYFNYRLT
ncbi:MAG: FGGY family carbohydrate kinase, partial [Candidatus Onthovivens sp.]|nr:FGGY family carbohydrate kinase [Candidatus Onthovivens sp.]